eukprot:653680-Hanusia_phi.AAC.2
MPLALHLNDCPATSLHLPNFSTSTTKSSSSMSPISSASTCDQVRAEVRSRCAPGGRRGTCGTQGLQWVRGSSSKVQAH